MNGVYNVEYLTSGLSILNSFSTLPHPPKNVVFHAGQSSSLSYWKVKSQSFSSEFYDDDDDKTPFHIGYNLQTKKKKMRTLIYAHICEVVLYVLKFFVIQESGPPVFLQETTD